ncbi:hypothetical protein [Nocardioides sp. W7]|uniref:hypothetical protein n=1 Tax=Nocardioides sp. W7 TaxID=2931390 RepID=UPI001FD168A8|nr:hypothetical protein [Nocardioides sp. W7]
MTTTDLDSHGGNDLMSAQTRGDFQQELERLRATGGLGSRDKLAGTLGLLMCLAAAVVVLLCFRGTGAASDLRDQMEMLVLALFGVGLAVVGAALYVVSALQRFFRFWLLRLVYEQRDLARRAD